MGLNKNQNSGNFNGEVGDMSNYATKSDLATKVTKETNKSLVDNTLIDKLEDLENYDDSLVREEINSINSQLAHITHKVNIKEKMSKGLTATEAFKEAIKEAYNKSYNNTGWRSPLVIEIPSGEYVIDDTLIDDTTGVPASRFVFKGYGYQNTKIIFKPNQEKFLFNNEAIFGFTTFENIAFESNNLGKFMNGVGGGSGVSGNAQGFVFEKCGFYNWKNIIYTTGETMMSEVTFRDCRISGGDSSSIMFYMENSQAVNWRFFGTDIENFSGVMIQFMQGSTFTFYQGSIIPQDGIVVYVPLKSTSNNFGAGNNPCVQFDGSRFELRGKSHLVKAENYNAYTAMIFRNCGMGGQNLSSDTHYTLDLAMRGYLKFIDCHNMSNFAVKDIISNATSYTSPKRLIFENCDLNINDFIEKSITEGMDSNVLGCAIIEFNNSVYKLLNSMYTLPNYPIIKKLYRKNNSESNTFDYFPSTGKDIVIEEFTYKTIHDISVVNIGLSGYGSTELPFRITNADKSIVLLTGIFNIGSNTRITQENFIPYFIGKDDYLIFEIGEIEGLSGSTLRFNGFLEISHQ